MSADVAKEDDVRRVIEDTGNTIGPIDLFCSNAGVAAGASEQSANAEWELCWNVNVMSHVYAARHLVPRMLERGHGYFLYLPTAARLLHQLGGVPHRRTQHAALPLSLSLVPTHSSLAI